MATNVSITPGSGKGENNHQRRIVDNQWRVMAETERGERLRLGDARAIAEQIMTVLGHTDIRTAKR